MEMLIKDDKAMPAKSLSAEQLSVLLHKTRWQIAKLLAQKPDYAGNIAKRLNIEEQLIYYHIRELQKAGLISIERTEEKQGAVAKYFTLAAPAFSAIVKEEWREFGKQRIAPKFFEDFVKDGKLSCKIIVGSPDPHGPSKARARDPFYGIDLALLLGSMCHSIVPATKLDTEIRERDLQDNIICIGGPIVNLVTARFNEELPVRINLSNNNIISDISGKEYSEDASGMIVKADNPLAKGKKLLVIAGKRFDGVKAAILYLVKHPESDFRNSHDNRTFAKVVEGQDLDGDGVIDDAEVKE